MKTTAIYTNKRGTTLVKLEKDNKDNKDIEWVVCSEYNEHAKEGEKWIWGHYFDTFEEACTYMNQKSIYVVTAHDIEEMDESSKTKQFFFSQKEDALDAAKEYIEKHYPKNEKETAKEAISTKNIYMKYDEKSKDDWMTENNTHFMKVEGIEWNQNILAFNPSSALYDSPIKTKSDQIRPNKEETCTAIFLTCRDPKKIEMPMKKWMKIISQKRMTF